MLVTSRAAVSHVAIIVPVPCIALRSRVVACIAGLRQERLDSRLHAAICLDQSLTGHHATLDCDQHAGAGSEHFVAANGASLVVLAGRV